MATKVGTMQAKSKSESSQKPITVKRPATKYKSLTLTRQKAKLDVTELDLMDQSSMLDNSTTSDYSATSDLNNSSFIKQTSKWFENIGAKLFVTPETAVQSPSRRRMKSSSSVSEARITLRRKRSFVM